MVTNISGVEVTGVADPVTMFTIAIAIIGVGIIVAGAWFIYQMIS